MSFFTLSALIARQSISRRLQCKQRIRSNRVLHRPDHFHRCCSSSCRRRNFVGVCALDACAINFFFFFWKLEMKHSYARGKEECKSNRRIGVSVNKISPTPCAPVTGQPTLINSELKLLVFLSRRMFYSLEALVTFLNLAEPFAAVESRLSIRLRDILTPGSMLVE